ncbi:nuclease-related domain-containing protein [Bacillus marasmi]|uniref:nuclease-related domain-containing protein n=1 Tax=Bacillus marasmi TaxID=1926279 RepID=UPI00164D75E7|nr:nuclease-related domain-containing protein [Bacillus marasmi]
MEICKQRPVPTALTYMRSLNARIELTDKQKLYCSTLEKGYTGEPLFDQLLLSNLTLNCLVLNDVLLESNNNEFQIDTFIITQTTLYQLDVKNMEGDYYLEDNKWYTFPKNDIKNPMIQLERSETLIRQLKRELGFQLEIKPLLIFVNPGFQLYHAPPSMPIIFPSQLYRFMKKLNNLPAHLTEKHYNFAEKLLSLHLPVSKNMKIPAYTWESTGKGMLCGTCFSLDTVVVENKLVCRRCGGIHELDAAVIRNIEELKFLFPDLRITTKLVQEWCGVGISKKTIRRILMKNYQNLGHGKSSHFVDF